MKRSSIQRKSPMKPGSSVLRRGALLRQSALTRTAMKAKPAGPPEVKLRTAARKFYPSWPTGLRDAVMARAGNRCDICGQPLSAKSWECHHRRLRSQGGLDEPENLLALHHSCHDGAHRNRVWARDCGYIVHRGDDPATRPVWRHGRAWQLPTSDGWVAVEAPANESETA